jgi:hypothetical protein
MTWREGGGLKLSADPSQPSSDPIDKRSKTVPSSHLPAKPSSSPTSQTVILRPDGVNRDEGTAFDFSGDG